LATERKQRYGSREGGAGRFSAPLAALCAEALGEVARFEHPADAVLSAFFREHRQAGQQDRALIAETVYAALRRWRLLQTIAPNSGARRLALAAWATLMGANLRELESSGLERGDAGWLAEVKGLAAQPQPFEVQADLPDWIIAELRTRFDDATLLRHARAFQQAAPLDLRVNLLATTREQALARLAADGLAGTPTPYSPAGIRLVGKPAINRHALFESGAVEVQDEGSQLLALLLDPRRGEMVVDYCAGAGGKTLALGALMKSTGRLYAFDISARRLANLRPRLARSGLSNVHPQRIERGRDPHVRRLAGKIDRVLVDAPCSGLGTLRRNPDLKMRHGPTDVEELTARQAAILDEAARLVKPGGRLVYATCSILERENQGTVAAFLARAPEFQLLPAGEVLAAQRVNLKGLEGGAYLELWPDVHGTDGFFAAVLQRRLA
jgi:16S rRNA (cytosine967-C5)-methyltransferase